MNREKEMSTDDLHDQSFLIESYCPECRAQVISHPDCTITCSNRKCKMYNIWIKEAVK